MRSSSNDVAHGRLFESAAVCAVDARDPPDAAGVAVAVAHVVGELLLEDGPAVLVPDRGGGHRGYGLAVRRVVAVAVAVAAVTVVVVVAAAVFIFGLGVCNAVRGFSGRNSRGIHI